MKQRPYLIGIAGPSGAGKTTLAEKIATELHAPILTLDSYYRHLPEMPFDERAQQNFDEPSALDTALLFEQVARLATGADIPVPVYDFARHLRAEETVPLPAGDFIVIEGIFALYWSELRAMLGTKVFIAADDGICFHRRLERDVRERGRTPGSVLDQYAQTVRPMAERYVLPTRQYADVVVSGTGLLAESAAAVMQHVERTRANAAIA